MQGKSNALQWVLVYCNIGFGDSYFEASFYTVLTLTFCTEGKQSVCTFLVSLLLVGWLCVGKLFLLIQHQIKCDKEVFCLTDAQADVCVCVCSDTGTIILFLSG